MIIDKIENYKLYTGLGKNIYSALEHIRNTDFTNKKTGRYDIDGENIFVIISDYTTKNITADSCLEAHRKYIDVQYMVKGAEQVGYAPLLTQVPVTEYNDEKDFIFFKGEMSLVNFNTGMFTIFFPDDLHMPGVGKNPSPVKKVVIKVKI